MKIKFMAFLIFVSMAFMSCITGNIRGNGDITTDERILPSFEKIESSGSTEVRFHSSAEYRAVVTIDSNLNEYFETTVIGNVLIIRPKSGTGYTFTKNIVDVYCPVISEISISGSGKFEMLDTINVPKFKINISGSGKIYGNIECDDFSARISGSGNMNISGNSEDADIYISGSGDFNGSEFKVNNYFVNISGSGKADIFVEDSLTARTSGSGDISFRGNAKFDFRSSGSGGLTKIE
jgi:hypothetical protein